jgi:hypothetical protein
MNLNYNNEKMLKTTKDENFKTYNETICNDEHFKLSQRNLIMMYIYLYNFFINKNLLDFNTYLNKTTYFNKIIFLKYLIFFRKLNELQKRFLAENEPLIKAENKKIENFKNQFISNTIMLLINNKYIYYSDLATLLTTDTEPILQTIDNIITTLFDAKIIDNIYNIVITNIDNNPHSFEEYLTLFHLNNKPINNSSSDKAIFFIGFHGSLFTVIPDNTYLTIKTPVDTTINRWGIRGDPTKFFNSMKYTFKQCLLMYGEENLNNFNANTCFQLLGTSITNFNYDTSQTTTAYCKKEPDNFFYNLIGFKKNEKMRIKHYGTDSYYFNIFNTDYTIPDTLFNNLLLRIPKKLDKTIQYNSAENIINLNFLLFTNNIDFNVFNMLNIKDETSFDKFNLYPDIGLYTKYYIQENNKKLQSHLHNFYFPLDIVSFNGELFIEDFVLERDIFTLNNINIHLKYQDVDRSFVLLKGDSFSCNPYIIEYFIKTFNSKITIRPGPILGNKEDEIFKENRKNYTTIDKGSTVTCLSKGLSCYKVILSVITNYEILQFCKDANINTCDLYDTSCQSFGYIDDNGKIIDNYTPPQKKTLQRMKTKEDSTMLAKYDNLSDIFFSMDPELDLARDFLVVGNILVKRKLEPEVTPVVNSDETPNLKRIKIEGGTQKFINRKKNTRKRKQTKNSYKRKQTKNTNTRKQKKKKTKKMYK